MLTFLKATLGKEHEYCFQTHRDRYTRSLSLFQLKPRVQQAGGTVHLSFVLCTLRVIFSKSIGLAKKLLCFFPYDGSSSAQLSLTSLETILLNYIVTAVISACIKKLIKISDFLCSHFNMEDGKNTQHFEHIILYYFKKGKNTTETQNKNLCSVWSMCCD